MRSEVTQLWIEALRSGKYEKALGQDRKFVYDRNTYSEIGLLFELHRQNAGPDEQGEWQGIFYNAPDRAYIWAGLSAQEQQILMALRLFPAWNYSFEEFAQFIENGFKGRLWEAIREAMREVIRAAKREGICENRAPGKGNSMENPVTY